MNETPQIYLGSDHGGYHCKQTLLAALRREEVLLEDVGSFDTNRVDYPNFAYKVAKLVLANQGSFGVLLCRSGEGMQMAANKVPGIRAALVWNEVVAAETRADNDANIVVLPADFIGPAEAIVIVRRFLATPFSDLPRHQRRIAELTDIEELTYAI